MQNLLFRTLLGGVAATAAMVLSAWIIALTGLPEIDYPEMISQLTHFSVGLSWLLFFMCGVLVSLLYTYGYLSVVRKITGKFIKGAMYGVLIFLVVQIIISLLEMASYVPQPEGHLLLIILTSLVLFLIYGIVLTYYVRK